MGKKRKLRKKIAKHVINKMTYMNECPNVKASINNIILHRKDRYSWKPYCDTICWKENCTLHPKYVEYAKKLEESKGEL